jgi:hypothetical protein
MNVAESGGIQYVIFYGEKLLFALFQGALFKCDNKLSFLVIKRCNPFRLNYCYVNLAFALSCLSMGHLLSLKYAHSSSPSAYFSFKKVSHTVCMHDAADANLTLIEMKRIAMHPYRESLYINEAYLTCPLQPKVEFLDISLFKEFSFLFHVIHGTFYWRILQETTLGLKIHTKICETRKLESIHKQHFVERKIDVGKPDKNSSL